MVSLHRSFVSTQTLLVALLACLHTEAAERVLYFDINGLNAESKLSYEEQVLAFTAQGLVNRDQPALFFDAGFLDFDWPSADEFWRRTLEQRTGDDAVAFTNLTTSICGLITGVASIQSGRAIQGIVLYANANISDKAYTLPMALTIASQQSLLPVTPTMLSSHPCLKAYTVVMDLTNMPEMTTRDRAWQYSIEQLLPNSSKTTIYNLYHDDVESTRDPQSPATIASLDYAIAKNAFILDLQPSATTGEHENDPALLASILSSHMDPLFDAFGWAHDEHAWTEAVSVGGGTVFCSFASPNLSFWALLKLVAAAGGKTRRLHSGDSGRPLDRSKYYVTFETNEGDTPRIAVSAFGSSWASSQRGSIPVAWSVDPLLSARFPALMDHFASTALQNDSFVAGVAGSGYVYLGALNEEQMERYASRVGQMFATYGPQQGMVADTYGSANLSTLATYSKYAKQNGSSPIAYVSQPLWAHGVYAQNSYRCPVNNMFSPFDHVPLICTSNNGLFYRNGGINPQDPGADLAMKIRNASQGWEPPFFISVYGGLTWTAAGLKPKEEFWFMLQRTMDVLGSDYVAVGANEMARLASSACTSSTPPPPPPPLTCSISVEQEACTPIPGQPWKNSTEVACLHLGCCWHEHGVKPSGHTCVKPESSGTPYTCAKPRASIMG